MSQYFQLKKVTLIFLIDIDTGVLDRLVATFAELRAMADQGQTQYPYSTREAVAIVKHLAQYPDEGIQAACSNVFDFDVYNEEASKLVVNILQRHGIPVNAKNDDIRMAAEWSLSEQKPSTKSQWSVLPEFRAFQRNRKFYESQVMSIFN